MQEKETEIAIVGTGFSGINMAISLLKNKMTSFVIFEKSAGIGGVWRDNIYPGCSCDIRASLYSIKSEPNPDWSRGFPNQNEICDYLQSIVKKYDLHQKIRFNTSIQSAEFIEKEGVWKMDSSAGSFRAKVLILATGPQRLPSFPVIPGRETFTKKSFHSAQWDNTMDLKGLKVAVIGTGASSIQIVPGIQNKVSKLYLFQRSPAWILPRLQRKIGRTERKLYNKFPFLLKAKREILFWLYEVIGILVINDRFLHKILTNISKASLKAVVKNKDLRKKLIPKYRLGCKRILISDHFFQAVKEPNVHLVTTPISEISENSIHTESNEYPVDAIIYATGFTVADIEKYIEIKGLNGVSLNESWEANGAEAFLGTHISGFPNLCYLLGPNSGLSHSSALHAMESQVHYTMQYLRYLKRQPERTYINIRPEVQQDYNKKLQEKMKNTIWNSGCTSWFLNKEKKNTVIFPGSLVSFRRATRNFEIKNYEIRRFYIEKHLRPIV